MRWAALTAVLLAAWVGGAAWIFLRDRERFRPQAVGPSQAQAVTARLLCAGRPALSGSRCRTRVLRTEGPDRWRVRLAGPPARCFSVQVDTDPGPVLRAGAEPVPCD